MVHENNPGDYYKNKEQEARHYSQVLNDLLNARGELNAKWAAGDRSPELADKMREINEAVKRTERALERARYVGD